MMSDEEVAAIEVRWNGGNPPNYPYSGMASDFDALLAEVRRLRAENAALLDRLAAAAEVDLDDERFRIIPPFETIRALLAPYRRIKL